LVTLQGQRGEDVEIRVLSFPANLFTVTNRGRCRPAPIDLADENSDGSCSDSIDVLIGSDFYWHIVIGDIVRGDSGPIALNSHLSWLVSGPTKSLTDNYTVSTLIIDGDDKVNSLDCGDCQLMKDLNNFWDTEAIGTETVD